MDKKYIWILVIGVIVVLLIAGKGKTGASLKVDLDIGKDQDLFAIVTGPKTLVDVDTVPFSLTITNNGGTDFTNVKLGPGTIPNTLNSAFSGLSIASLPAGKSETIKANVDIASLAPVTGSKSFNFQAHIIADYVINGQPFTKSGFSEMMVLTISPGAGLAVNVTY